MNAQEWYREVKKHDGGMVAFCCDQLAAKDCQIEKLRSELVTSIQIKNGVIQELERKLESSQRQVADKAMKIVNQRSDIEYLRGLIGDERKANLETKQKLEAAEKRAVDAMSRLIENWLSKEYMPKILGFDLAKGESWTARAYATGWDSNGLFKQADSAQFRPLTRIERRAEARRCRDAGIKPLPGTYGEDDLRELEIFERVKSNTPECNQGEECPTCNTIAARRFEEWRLAREQQAGSAQTTSDWGSGSCGESAAENESMAENEARETESLAHKVDTLWREHTCTNGIVDAEKRLGMHDTQFRRTTERFDRHAKKLIDLDRLITNAMKGAAEKRAHANARIGTAEANIADIRKTAEADRVEFRAADAAVHERISKVVNATLGEGFEMPDAPLLGRIQRIERELFGP